MKIIGWIFTSFVVLMGWVIFYYTDTASLTYMFKVLFGFSDRPVNDLFINLTINEYFYLLMAASVGCMPIARVVKRGLNNMYNSGRVKMEFAFIATCIFVLLVLFTSSAMLVAKSYNPFLYFRF